MKKAPILLTVLALSVLSALALASVVQSPQTGSGWPQGTQFLLLDSSGNVLLSLASGQEPGQVPPDLLSKAATLKVVLPNGTALELKVTVEGEGEGLGEVKLSIDGRLVPLPELLHGEKFTVQDGRIARVKKEDKEDEEEVEEVEEDEGKSSAPSNKGEHEEHEEHENHQGHEEHGRSRP